MGWQPAYRDEHAYILVHPPRWQMELEQGTVGFSAKERVCIDMSGYLPYQSIIFTKGKHE